jgi:hypothetical protein
MRQSIFGKRFICAAMASLLTFGMGGCASYSTRQVQIDSKSLRTESPEGTLCVYVDEYASESKCKQAFDSQLSTEGVLPLLVKIENNGPETYEYTTKDFTVTGGAALRSLTVEEAAKKAKRDAVGRAIGLSLIVPIVAIPIAVAASASHTKEVNQKIREDFNAKTLKDGVILPYKEISGFLFYEMPPGQKDLNGLELSVAVRKQSTQEPVNIVAPLPNVSFKPAKDPAKAAEIPENSGYGHK